MSTLIKNITLFVLALAIGLAQPLAAAIDFNGYIEIELADEKDLELKEEAELFASENKKEKEYFSHYELNNLQTQFRQKCAVRSALVAKLHHKLYIYYDTWLV